MFQIKAAGRHQFSSVQFSRESQLSTTIGGREQPTPPPVRGACVGVKVFVYMCEDIK